MLRVLPRRSQRLCVLQTIRHSSSSSTSFPPLFKLQNASIYPLGSGPPSPPIFSPFSWTLHDTPTEAWALVGRPTSTLTSLFQQHNYRVLPPGSISHPFLSALHPTDRYGRARPTDFPSDVIRRVAFNTRLGGAGGGFVDYSARYGAMREGDRRTLREELVEANEGVGEGEVVGLAKELGLERQLDVPLVGLSNGQTRRARIGKALASGAEVLVLEEPFTGLDPPARAHLSALLGRLHASRAPRILLVLRPTDALPEWITHVLAIGDDGVVRLGRKGEVELPRPKSVAAEDDVLAGEVKKGEGKVAGKELVRMDGVNISYKGREVLKDIHWTVRAGERWHLQGYNGSGKTTLLSLLLGDHPLSYTQPLHLFSLPRSRHATPLLQLRIGHTSPELFASFPRTSTLSAFDAVATGLHNIFCYRALPSSSPAPAYIRHLFARIAPDIDPSSSFAGLAPGHQSAVLLMRALVRRPEILVLDEPFAGMEREGVRRARRFLREDVGEEQAVVFVSHWEEEVPWRRDEGRVLRLEGGRVERIE